MRSRCLVACVLFMGFVVSAAAQPRVSALRLGENADRTRFVIDVGADIETKVFALADPYRLVIDLPEVEFDFEGQGSEEGRGLVSRYRYGLFAPGTSRVVLDLERPARLERFFTLPPQGRFAHRLVFDIVPTDERSFRAAVRKPRKMARAEPSTSEIQPTPSIKRQREKRIVVLDPGHGGIDPGAPGVSGLPEKVVTLQVAREAARQLAASGRYTPILTRDKDIAMSLRERVKVARDAQADLFVSLHGDSLDNRRVRGATVYTLSETASDKEAAALAARENKADVLAGMNLAEEAPEVANILIDLAQRETMNYSARFANFLIPELGNRAALRRNSHRFAGFAVLKAPDVPSVLLEMGYMSNRQDAAFLTSEQGQKRIGAALVSAIDRYFAAVDRESF